MMVATALLLVTAAVQVEAGAPCVERSELAAALNDAGAVQVSVSIAAPGVLRVKATWPGGQSIERKVPAGEGECPAVRRVVITLVKAWLAAPPAAPPRPPGKVEGVPRERPPITPSEVAGPPRNDHSSPGDRSTEGRRSTPLEVSAVDGGASIDGPSTPLDVSGKRSPNALTPIDGAPATPLEVSSLDGGAQTDGGPATSVGVDGGPSRWHFAAAALAGTTAGTTPEAVAAGSFLVEVVRDRTLGAGVEGGLESSRSSGTAWASQRWLTLFLKGAVPLNDRVTLAATLGVRGWLAEVGAAQVPSQNLFAAGAALTLGAEVELGPVVLHLRAVGAARFPEDRVKIAGQTALFLKWWQVGALAGLGWHFP